MPRLGIAARTDIEAARRLDDLKLRLAILLIVRALGATMQRIRMEFAAVEEGDVARIDAAFHRLQVIAFLPTLADVPVRGGKLRPLEGRRRGLKLRWPHVSPQNPAALDQRVGFQIDLIEEAAFLRVYRHLDARAGVVVFPAGIGCT